MRGSKFAVRTGCALAAAAVAGVLTARSAAADLCSDCPPPSDADVRAAAGAALADPSRYYVLDAGECTFTLTGSGSGGTGHKFPIWHVHDGAFNCPDAKKDGLISFHMGRDERFEWSVSVEGGTKADAFVVSIKEAILAKLGMTTENHADFGVEQKIVANWCHRVEYWAYFFVGEVKLHYTFTVKRRWQWWVKSFLGDSSKVYAKGDIWVNCGTGTAVAERLEPLDMTIGLYDHGCKAHPDCKGVVASQWDGFFPPIPPGWDPFGPEGPYPKTDPTNPGSTPPPAPPGAAPPPTPTPAPPATPQTPGSTATPPQPGAPGTPATPGGDPDDGPTSPGTPPVTPGSAAPGGTTAPPTQPPSPPTPAPDRGEFSGPDDEPQGEPIPPSSPDGVPAACAPTPISVLSWPVGSGA